MQNFFNMDSPFWRFMGTVADIMILNTLFIICSIPIFTIGASTTALYYITLKLAKNEEGYIIKGFFQAFKNNFKKSTLIWLILMCIGLILGFDLYFVQKNHVPGMNVLQYVFLALLFVFTMTACYIFPLQSKFENTILATFKNAIIIGILNLVPWTVLLVFINILPILPLFITMQSLIVTFPLMLIGGFATIAFVNSKILNRVFKKYIPAETVIENDDEILIETEN